MRQKLGLSLPHLPCPFPSPHQAVGGLGPPYTPIHLVASLCASFPPTPLLQRQGNESCTGGRTLEHHHHCLRVSPALLNCSKGQQSGNCPELVVRPESKLSWVT